MFRTIGFQRTHSEYFYLKWQNCIHIFLFCPYRGDTLKDHSPDGNPNTLTHTLIVRATTTRSIYLICIISIVGVTGCFMDVLSSSFKCRANHTQNENSVYVKVHNSPTPQLNAYAFSFHRLFKWCCPSGLKIGSGPGAKGGFVRSASIYIKSID